MNLWPRNIPLYFNFVIPGILLGLMGLFTMLFLFFMPFSLIDAALRRKEESR